MIEYEVPAQTVEHEFVIKNSRFIASIWPVTSASESHTHLLDCQRQWPGANHYCTAAITAAPSASQSYAMSDDGEPSGTAGMPMLNVLLNNDIGEISVVVVRYFGGVKLGTGGLQRAYTQAVVEALQKLPRALKIPRKKANIRYAYSDQSAVQHLLQNYEAITVAQYFAEDVRLELEVVSKTQHSLATELQNATQGRVQLSESSISQK